MVKVLTSHHSIWHPEQVVAQLIQEYQTQGRAAIDLNNEGPCADTIGLYRLLDGVCQQFAFDPAQIEIVTANREEQHSRYRITVRNNLHWFSKTLTAYRSLDALAPKNFNNLFGCLYNVPSWDRLCLLSYIHRTTQHSSLLTCNGTWQPDRYNTYYLNTLIDHAPTELANVAEYLKTNPSAALDDVAEAKPVTAEHQMQVWPLYSDFFVDVVAETYNTGLSFFVTEKTLRPMLALTPFVVNAPPGYLSMLKYDFGFRTFDAWWDEDYDNYQGYERIQRMYQIIDQLDKLSAAQCQDMYADMMPVLQHNKQHLLTYEQRR